MNLPLPAWVSQYIGLPWKPRGRDLENGLDCWGLVRFVSSEEFGVDLPSYDSDYERVDQPDVLESVVDKRALEFSLVEKGDEMPGDIVVLRVGRMRYHVGIVVQPGQMLHIFKGANSVVESYRSHIWTRRVDGFYRAPE